jgi:hypothetical protein
MGVVSGVWEVDLSSCEMLVAAVQLAPAMGECLFAMLHGWILIGNPHTVCLSVLVISKWISKPYLRELQQAFLMRCCY